MLIPPWFRAADPGMGPEYNRHVIKCGACGAVWECYARELRKLEAPMGGASLIMRCKCCLRETLVHVGVDGAPWGADRLLDRDEVERE